MLMKKNVMIRIDANVAERAKEIGLNISKVCENALIHMINAIESSDNQNESTNQPISYLEKKNGGLGGI